MNLEEAINHPSVNVFDIIPFNRSESGFQVVTYPKPNETDKEFEARHAKNYQRAFRLKNKGQD